MSDKRASIFDDNALDLSEFKPQPSTKPQSKDEVKTIAEKSNFVSREVGREINHDVLHSGYGSPLRHKVIRTDQINAKVQRPHYELFYRIVNVTGKKNAEVIELALEAYAKQLGLNE